VNLTRPVSASIAPANPSGFGGEAGGAFLGTFSATFLTSAGLPLADALGRRISTGSAGADSLPSRPIVLSVK
jgi:hypothetical protein